MYPVLDAFEAYLDRKCGFVSYTFFCGRFLKKKICNSHSWKTHRSDLPQFRSFEMHLRSWAWCPVEHTRHFRWVTLFGMVKNVTPSKLGWWPPTIQWWKRVTTWITWRFFGMIFSWGVFSLVFCWMESWNLSQRSGAVFAVRNEVLPWRVTTWKRPCKSWARNFSRERKSFQSNARMEERYDDPATKKGNMLLETKWMVWRSRHVFFWGMGVF